MENKFKFASIASQIVESDNYSVFENRREGKWIRYGVYDEMPNQLIRFYNESSVHNTCVNAVVESIVGEGLTANNPNMLEQANTEGESWNDVFKKAALDYYIFGGFALEIIWTKDRSRIAEVYHVDFSLLRAKERDYKGRIPGYYISDLWGKKMYLSNFDLTEVPYLPVFNPIKNANEPNQLFVHRPYKPGLKYYPLPHYVGALKVIDLDCEIDTFHLANVKNGLAPSIAITTYTNANEEERGVIENQIQNQYAGAANAGRVFYMDVASKEEKPDIETLALNTADGYYNILNESTTQKILTAHRITSPMMLGIKTPGQLGGREELLDAYNLFLTFVIKPYQEELLACFTELLEYNYDDVTLGIQQIKILTDGATKEEVVTEADASNQEDAALENQTIQNLN